MSRKLHTAVDVYAQVEGDDSIDVAGKVIVDAASVVWRTTVQVSVILVMPLTYVIGKGVQRYRDLQLRWTVGHISSAVRGLEARMDEFTARAEAHSARALMFYKRGQKDQAISELASRNHVNACIGEICALARQFECVRTTLETCKCVSEAMSELARSNMRVVSDEALRVVGQLDVVMGRFDAVAAHMKQADLSMDLRADYQSESPVERETLQRQLDELAAGGAPPGQQSIAARPAPI